MCGLDVRWQSFEQYVTELKKLHFKTARGIHRELNKFRRSGLAIWRLQDCTSVSGQLHAVVDAHYRRLNASPFQFQSRFFELLQTRLGHKAVVCQGFSCARPWPT